MLVFCLLSPCQSYSLPKLQPPTPNTPPAAAHPGDQRRITLAVCLDFSALPSLLDVLTPPGEARPLDLSSSRGPGASFFRPLLIDIWEQDGGGTVSHCT